MTGESNGPVSFFDDQIILTSESCVLPLECVTTKYQRTVPNILSKVGLHFFFNRVMNCLLKLLLSN